MKHKSVFPVRLKYALFPTMEVTYIHAIVVYNTSTGRTCTVSCLLKYRGMHTGVFLCVSVDL